MGTRLGSILPRPARATVPLLCALLALALASLAQASRADGFIYWSQHFDQAIGRANLDGTNAQPGFLQPGVSTCGVGVDDTYVYWAVGGAPGGSIARAKLDGTGVEPNFITGTSDPCGIALDGSHIYWANFQGGSIGRANIDGTGVDQTFVNTGPGPCGLAVSPGSIYWTDTASIGRAKIDGSSPNGSFITGINDDCGSLATNSAHLYFGSGLTSIGRANLDGSGLNLNFISGVDFGVCGVAVDDAHVYWGDYATGRISRASLAGTGVEQGFISTPNATCAIAVDDGVRSTSTELACAPAQVAALQPVTCTATVADTGDGAGQPPPGRVSFSSSDSSGTIAPAAGCTLVPSGALSSTCSITYTGSRTANLLASYEGREGAYAESSAVGGPTVGSFALGAVSVDRKHGRATVAATAPGPGVVALAGAGVNPASQTLTAAGPVTLPVQPNRTRRKQLRKRGELTVTVLVTFTPTGGGQAGSASTDIELQRKLKRKRGGEGAS